jgi:phosphopentomutase
VQRKVERIILIVLDSVGIGAMPDADSWGDKGANTLGNIARARGGLVLPNLGELGLGNLLPIIGTPPVQSPAGAYGKMAIASHGKDTMTGHWEMVGIRPSAPFRTYPDGFPADLIEAFCQRAGVGGVLGNTVASGTEMITDLGEAHIATGWPIVYTSADSVFQVAAHEEHFGLERLYEVCRAARELLRPPHRVGRIIARPFIGEDRTTFVRTANRHDYAIEPPYMLLNALHDAGQSVTAIGKISDIFSGQGISSSLHTKNNTEGIAAIHQAIALGKPGLIFANLVDFDMLYGHRRDVAGYAAALLAFDRDLPAVQSQMRPTDILVITADHGNDPTHPGTDHTREYVPVLVYGAAVAPGALIGTRPSLGDLGASIAALLGVPYEGSGSSFTKQILAKTT